MNDQNFSGITLLANETKHREKMYAQFNCLKYVAYHTKLSVQASSFAEVVSTGFHDFHFKFCLEIDSEYSRDIFLIIKAHFTLNGSLNTHNCRFQKRKNLSSILQIPLQSPNITVWCRFTASIILSSHSFEELSYTGQIIFSISRKWHLFWRIKLCHNKIELLHISLCYRCPQKSLHTNTFMIGGLHAYKTSNHAIFGFGSSKYVVRPDNRKILLDHKGSISQHFRKISQNTSLSAVENVSWINNGHDI